MIALALAAALLAGEPPVASRDCLDDNNRDLCTTDTRAKMRLRIDAPSAETLAADGWRGVRVFLIDGYGADKPSVALLARRGEEPVLEVRTAVRGRGPVILSATPDRWTRSVADLLSRTTLAAPEREAPTAARRTEPSAPPPPPGFCLHAWSTVVEVIDDDGITVRSRNGCGEQPIFDGAVYLAQRALHAQEGCHALSETYGGEAGKLQVCATLVGPNRWGDVWLRNRFDDLTRARGRNGAPVADFFAPDAVLTWPGEPERRGAEVAAFWSAGRADWSLFGNAVAWDRPPAETGEVRGLIIGRREGRRLEAPFTQHWAKGEDQRLRIVRWDVGAFVEPDDEE